MGTCKGCGKKIVWAILPGGGAIPLDPKPPVYQVSDPDAAHMGQVVATRMPAMMVTHFATCPKANNFSGGNHENKKVG